MNPRSIRIPVAVLAERRPGVTKWADEVWRVVEVLEEAPPVPAWTLLREEAGRSLFFAGVAEVALHPTDTSNYKHNLEAAQPLVWVALRPAATPAGFALQTVTVDPGEAHLHADTGNDLVEALPMPPGLHAATAAFVAEHHKEHAFYKRKRDRADPEALARRAPGAARFPAEEEE
ncbi:DUF3305 domain-containing protein [Falsiroseomonas oryzae]|uniref:DUF3305 domain-containing protein n=1 Tax=Falsiroseomonas oryzae TaxID=2766473 RepID=UPI0022EA5078|nr:DUF3305 domain-containing protein [Roseomonas sp. MO-31]